MDVTIEQTRCAEHVDRLRSLIDEALGTLVPAQEPAGLYEPVRYVLAGQGKRLRPVLLLLGAEAFGVEARRALPAAVAVEVFHNFTLVHDDIMDDAPARRGRPTVHEKWDEDTAILCGDYLLALSYDLLARVATDRLPRLLRVYSEMVARLCEGQTLDKAFETRHDVTVADYLHMIDGKTGALLQASLELGGLVGEASEAHRATLRAIGTEVGRAFQIQDDLLDLVAEDTRWGKPIGGDLIAGKKTLLLLAVLERTEDAEHDWFANTLYNGGLPAGEVPRARAHMDDLGVLDDARQAVLRHTTAALEHLEALPQGAAVDTLGWLLQHMQARMH
ncbi:MAG: polyprenyl synthetase family protein [Bacteroidetes bacterium]|nr:polyprenyl synthetase family protein [Bacteroidota bacterium]